MGTSSSPATLEDALAALSRGARVVNGGTDVMVPVNEGLDTVDSWLSLRKVQELRRIERTDRGLRIGAGVTFTRIEEELRDVAPALAQAASTVGSRQIRNVATIGGNVATASPAGDSILPLLTYDTEVELASTRGIRFVALADFFLGPKRTVRLADELVSAITITDTSGAQHFAKVGTRNAMVISICSIAVRLDRDRRVGRVAAGSVAPVPLLVPAAESALLHPDGADDFAAAVVGASSPITDHRATADYRRHALGVLATRVHRRLWEGSR